MGEVLTAVNNIREVFKDLRDALENKGYHVSPFAPKCWADIISAKGELTEEQENEINRLVNNGEVLEGARWSANNSLLEYLDNNRIYPTVLNISGCSDFYGHRLQLCNDSSKKMLGNTSSIFLSNMNSDMNRHNISNFHYASLKKVVAVDSESCETISSNTVEEMEYRNVKKTYFYDMDYTELKKLTLDIENNTCEDGYDRPDDITIDCDSIGSPKLEEFTLGDKYTGKLYMYYDKELGIPLEKVTIPNTLEKDSSLIISQGGTIKINGVSESDWGPYTIESSEDSSREVPEGYEVGWVKTHELKRSQNKKDVEEKKVTVYYGRELKTLSISGIDGTESSCSVKGQNNQRFDVSLSVSMQGSNYVLIKKETMYRTSSSSRDSNSQTYKTGCTNGVNYTVPKNQNYILVQESSTTSNLSTTEPEEEGAYGKIYHTAYQVGHNNTYMCIKWDDNHPEARFKTSITEEYEGKIYGYQIYVTGTSVRGYELKLTTVIFFKKYL